MNHLSSSNAQLPQFSDIQPEQIEPRITSVINENLDEINKLLQSCNVYTWDNLMHVLEDLDDRLLSKWSIINHLHSVMSSEKLRNAYRACLPKLSDYGAEIWQNQELFKAIQSIADDPTLPQLHQAQQQTIRNELRDFRLAGVNLSPTDKQRFRELQKQLVQLTNHFEENVLDATEGWNKLVTEPTELSGLPAFDRRAAQEAAQERKLHGWLFTLELPSYLAIMNNSDNRSLRQEMYHAYVTRASELGANAGRWDNSAVMFDILKARQDIAHLLHFNNYAELSLATKMAKNTNQVLNFLYQLAEASLAKARQEILMLREFASEQGNTDLQAWDILYYSEKMRKQLFDISQEELRPYFPEQQVLDGMFAIIKRLFGMQATEIHSVDTWHKDVRFFEIRDEQGHLRGHFYTDLYARLNKRSGAWMDDCRVRRRLSNNQIQTPIAFLTCNFNPPVGSDPALLTHDDVITLFHEFGHCLHHLLTTVDYPHVSGVHGVYWDAIEFPSQLLENWCWQAPALEMIAKHYKTGEPLPTAMLDKLRAAKNFEAGMQMVRQLEFAIFDFRLHLEFNPHQKQQIQHILDDVRKQVSVFHPPPFNCFQNSFTHIFGGGYSAGYYSYKWAEVLASDAFATFEENGIFDEKTGKRFLHTILEQGGSRDAMTLFKEFKGREPTVDALLRHSDIKS